MNPAGTERAAKKPQSPSSPGTGTTQAGDPAGATRLSAGGRRATLAARIAPAAIPAGVMAALGLWGLARDSSVSNDEAATRIAAKLSLGHLLFLLRHIDAVHGLYYALMHVWVVFGTGPVSLRVPSVIAMSAAAGLTGTLGARLGRSAWVGLFAGLVMAVTPATSFYGQTARSYALVYACVAGATLALVAAVQAQAAALGQAAHPAAATRARRLWLLYAALIAVGGYLNEMSLLVLAAHAVTLALCRFKWDMLRRWALAAAVGAALVSPLALVSLLQHASVSWIGPPTVIELRVQLQDYFGVTPLAAAIVGACVIVAVLPWRGADAPDQVPVSPGPRLSLQSVAGPLLIVPAALLMGESFIGPPLYVDRYVLFGECGAALLAGAGVVRLGRWLRTATGQRWLVWAPGIVVCAAVFLAQLAPQQSIRMPRSRLFDFNAPARYIGANARPGDGVLFFDTFFRKDRLLYPRDFANTDDFGQAHSPVQEGTFRGTDKAFAKVRPLILDHSRIWVVGMAPSNHLATWLLRQQSEELMRYFVLVRTRYFRGIDVTLWRRIPGPQSAAPP